MASRKRRNHNVRLIRRDYSYDIAELTKLFAIHPNTVGYWRKQGLSPIDDGRPPLFHGSDLIEFLSRRQSSRKHRCQPNELYCCRCRSPKRAWEGIADIEIQDNTRLLIKAVCSDCGAGMNRIGTVNRINEYRGTFAVQTTTDLRLKE